MLDVQFQAFAKWEPSRLIAQQKRGLRKYLYSVGGYGHKTSKRMLRRARKIRLSELPDEDREQYREDLEDFQNGYRDKPPVLRDIISAPGQPPLLHSDRSPLKYAIAFSVDEGTARVVWGPKKAKDGIAGDLEHGRGGVRAARPFVGPSYEKTLPKLPQFLRDAFN